MEQHIEAIYENGVLRLLEPVNLAEHQRVRLTIDGANGEDPLADLLDTAFMERCKRESSQVTAPGIDAVRCILSKVSGSLADDIIAERRQDR